MSRGDIRILKAHDVRGLLAGREADLIATVQAAYEAHAAEDSSLPHSCFLTFPDDSRNRIIALPAYLGAGFNVAGVKWIASFPDNHAEGLERASAVVIVNSCRTGRPEAIVEGSIISAKRTAASAALAARHLHGEAEQRAVGLIGGGLINLEVARFLRAVFPAIGVFHVFDTIPEQGQRFKERCHEALGDVEIVVAPTVEAVFESASLCSLATTASEPHIHDLGACAPGTTLLHVSLRDLSPEVILACDNVVDDVDHVCRARTSVHLAEQLTGRRDFVRCTLADITTGRAAARRDPGAITVFSPFGLGVLDMAVTARVLDYAVAADQGTIISSFLP